jgi:hypothetical protein
MPDIFDQFSRASGSASSGDIFDTLASKQQGGEVYEGQTKLDSDAQRQADEQGQVGFGEGTQASDVRMQEPYGGEERQRDIDSREPSAELRSRRGKEQVTGDIFDQLASRGGELDEESSKAKSQRTKVGQEAGQGVRGEGTQRDEAEIGLRKSWVPTPTPEQTGDAGSAIAAAGITGAEAYAGLKAGELAAKQTGKQIAKFTAKQIAKKAAGSVAAAVVAPIAGAETVATGGIGAPLAIGLEMAAFSAGDWIAEKAFNFVEGLLGVDEQLEAEREKNPELMKVASLAGMAPMALKSVKNYADIVKTKGTKEAAKMAAAGAAGGVAFEPIRYGVEAGLGAVTGQEEGPAPITAGSIAESALMGGVLAAHGAKQIKDVVGPETAKAAIKTPTDFAAETEATEKQGRKQFFTESSVMERASNTLKELEQRQAAGEELSQADQYELAFLQTMPDASKIAETYGFGIKKPSKPIYSTEEIITGKIQDAQEKLSALDGKPDTVANRKKKATLQSTIDKLQSDIAEGRTLEGQEKAKEVKPTEEVKSEEEENLIGKAYEESYVKPAKVADLLPLLEVQRGTQSDFSDIEKLKKSISERGFDEPVVFTYDSATGKGQITDGNHRIEAARQLGIKNVPIHFQPKYNYFDGVRGKNVKVIAPEGTEIKSAKELQEYISKPTEAPAEVQPTEPSETKEQKAGGVSDEQGITPVLQTEVEAEEGTTQRGGEGEEEVTAPQFLEEANTIEEVDSHVRSQKQKFAVRYPTNTTDPRLNAQNRETLGKESKALGMRASARKRQITDQLTPKERASEEKRQKSNYMGKPVEVDGLSGKVVGTSFGKIRVKFEDGSVKSVDPNDIISKAEPAKKPIKAPVSSERATSPEEVQAWKEKRIADLNAKEGVYSPKEKERLLQGIEEKATKRLADLEKMGKEQGVPKAKLVEAEKPLPAKPKGKRVLAAAYRRWNPETKKFDVFYGANHQHALHRAGLSWKEIKERYAHPEQREGKEFGYKTDTHKFVTRREGEQVARESKQADNLGIDKDKLSGLQMHSNRLTLDEYPGPMEAGVSVGAARSTGFEFGEKERNADLTKGAEIHQAGVKGFEDWKKKFLSAEKGKKAKYTERQLFNIFEQSEKLASYSTNYGKPLGEAIKNDEFWTSKTPEEIKEASKSKRTEAVQLTNERIDKERESRGLPSVMKEASVEWKSDWEEGMRRIDNDADYGPRLVASLKSNMRSISNPDKAVLSHQTLEAMNDRDAKASVLAQTTDPRLIAKRSRELDEAQQKFDELSELSARTNSEAGRALNFIKTLIGADYSLESLLVRAMAKNRRMGGTGEITKEERSRLSDLSKKVIEANDTFSKELAESKEANVANRMMEFIEFTQGIRRMSAGEAQASPKQEMQRFFSMLKASPNDPMSVGLAVRGMARSIAEGMGIKGKMTEKQANQIIDEVHAKMQKVMGDSWTKTQTNDALQGNGAFTQFAETDLKSAVEASIKSQQEFTKAYESILKIKNEKERNRRLDLLSEKRNIEFENIESQMKSIVDEELADISKYIGELDYELRSCE